MSEAQRPGRWQRRARPLLGTLVDIGIAAHEDAAACEAAFAAIARVQACMSRFEPQSDVRRFHGLAPGESMDIAPATLAVLQAAQRLQEESSGLFDISLGTAPSGWRCDGRRLTKLSAAVRLDLGGIAKGYAVDCAVAALQAHGCGSGWVNAGGDLRAFGEVSVPVLLRDEDRGGVRPFAWLADGALASSQLGPGCRSQAWGAPAGTHHASVAAPQCLWADALTKVVAVSGDARHPALARHGAEAWLH